MFGNALRFWVVFSLVVVLGFAGAAYAETPNQEQFYKMILELQQKTERLEKEAAAAKEEAAKTKKELDRLKKQLEEAKGASETVKPSASAKEESVSRSKVSAQREKGGVVVSYEYLHWKPSLSVLDFAIVDDYKAGPNSVRGSVKSVDPDEDAGYRLTIGYNVPNNRADVRLKFTRFDTKGEAVLQKSSSQNIWGIRLHPNAVIDDDDVTYADANYQLEYSVFDLELGYTHQLTRSADLRYFGGIRRVEMKQNFNILYLQDTGSGTRRVAFKEENHLDGFGPRVGLESKYYLGKGFSLFASGAASLMISDREYSAYEHDWGVGAINGTRRVDVDRHLNEQFIPGVDFDLGLAWEYPFGRRGSVTLMAGYHYENWFNAYEQIRFTDDVDSQLGAYDTSDLAIHGPMFKLNVTF